MSRLKVVLGALLVAGLGICAFGSSSALAMTLEECQEGPGTGVACGAGNFWTPLVGKQATSSVGTTNSVLTATVGGVEFQITCTGFSATGQAENVTVGEHMLILGSEIVIKNEGCSVTKSGGKACTVPATIETKSLKSETVTTTDKQKYVPTEGTTLASFEVGGAECFAALKGVKSITGSTTAVSNEVTGELEFAVTKASGELKYAGQNASFTGSTKLIGGGCASQAFARTP